VHDPIAASRRSALRAVATQAAVALLVALVFLAGDGTRAAVSAAIGGLALALGNVLATLLSLRGAVPARFAFAALLAGTSVKWLVVFVALGIALKAWQLPPLPMLAGLVAGLMAWLAGLRGLGTQRATRAERER
jgi:F0F1-type ATP synthase assembly protein I